MAHENFPTTQSMSSELCRIIIPNIPEDGLYEIFKRLKQARVVFRFESVCKLWKSIARRARLEHQLGLKLCPMLFSPIDEDFVSYDRKFSNGTPGWLLFSSPDCYSSVGLLNPLSGSYVPFPPMFNVIKAVASGSDPSSVVLAITSSQTLEFCNLCEGTWTEIGNETYACSDIVYCDKKFYVLNEMGEVLLCDLRSKPELEVISPSTDDTWDKRLVELSGDLLQVIRRESKFVFEVLKLDFNARRWIPVTSLEDHALLWTDNQCSSVSSKDFPEIKSDCIYFVDQRDGSCRLRTFELKSKKCNIVIELSERVSRRCLWFTPDVTIRSNTTRIDLPCDLISIF